MLVHLMSGMAIARENTPPNGDDLITGLVIDQTLTFVGHEFSSNFANAWKELPCLDHRILTIYERPSASWGSLVWVEYEHQMAFRAFLAPTKAKLKSTAEGAAQLVCNRVTELDIQKALFVDPDLARDEL
ncbi:MAG: hypothetical protein KGZ83_18600 [Sulfuricella sp.]|nr:hypothetical protein [Sulfuricella sp.]